ncbi:MAG: LD-carboxypeptidase [Lachnospiraceae bacterium]
MRIPEFLKDGGTIGFAAPSFGCNIEPYKSGFISAQEKFKSLGYRLEIGENCYEGCGTGISNTPLKCGQELDSFMAGKRADAVISCGGGELMCEVLDYTSFDKIAEAEPIWYMGFSDNTNMTFLLPVLCDTAAIYAPCAPAFGMRTWHKSIHDAFGLLTGKISEVQGYSLWEKESLKTEENPLEPYNVTEKRETKYYNCNGGMAEFSGRLIGGCLDCLSTLTGTKYDKVTEFNERYKEDGIIWFLEACDLNVMGIRRALWQLAHAGWFKYVRGFLIGRPYCFGMEFFGLDQYKAVTGILGEYNVPIIMDLDIGHLPPMMPLVTGVKADIRAQGNDISVKFML